MYPIIELYNEEAVHVSTDCSSNEMRIANNQHHVTADVHATCLNLNRDTLVLFHVYDFLAFGLYLYCVRVRL